MKKNNKKKLERKEFLGITWMLSTIGLFNQAGIALYKFFKPRVEAGAFGGKVVAGRIEEFEVGKVSLVRKGRFYISVLEDGGMLALWQQCTHLGCTVPWVESANLFQCPCHSSIFTPEGEIVSGPAPRPLDIFPIEIIDGEIVVDTGKQITRTEHDDSHVTYIG